jgi:2-polyprenyl-3-methyl-5-hydroxy-6-metoxy-1,4-benzoquinol methylase
LSSPEPPPEITAYYAQFPEESRLSSDWSRLEFERTKEVLSRVLPKAPARVLDVGGAAGVYSLWLAERGHEVHLVDASPRLVEEARRRSAASPRPLASQSIRAS